MNRRRIAYAAVAVATVLCIVGVSVAAVATGGSALAYEVNGTRVSQRDFDRQLDDIANTKVTEQVSKTSGSVDSRVTASVLQSNILRQLLRDAAAREGVNVTDADRAAAKDQLGSDLQGYPAGYQELQVDFLAHVNALGTALGLSDENATTDYIRGLVRRADVHINPRYGFWSPRNGVCPPTGCSTTSSGG
jgi:hypothetical protein